MNLGALGLGKYAVVANAIKRCSQNFLSQPDLPFGTLIGSLCNWNIFISYETNEHFNSNCSGSWPWTVSEDKVPMADVIL